MDMIFFAGIFLGLLVSIFWDEFAAWVPFLSRRMILYAASRFGGDLKSRLTEEWLRHLEDVPGTLSRIFFAFQCLLAAERLVPNPRKIQKRIFDLLFSASYLILCWPVYAVIAVFIKFDDWEGPVLVRREITGRGGKRVFVTKFRTEGTKRSEFGNLTRIGRILARTDLATLPMMFDVLKGNLSMVGPNPFMIQRKKYDMNKKYLEDMKPGFIDIKYSFFKGQHSDVEQSYFENCSVWNDFMTVTSALVQVLFPRRRNF